MIKRFFWIILFCCLYGSSFSQNYNQIYIDSNTNNDFSLLDSALSGKRVAMLGENHLFRKSNYKLEFKMMKHLNAHHGYDHLLLEFGYSIGYLADTYIQTGDSTLGNIIEDYFFKEFQALFDSIRTLNLSLDTNNCPKVRVTSIDIERSIPIAIKVSSLLLPDELHVPHDSIAFHIETLRSLSSYADRLVKKNKEGDADAYIFSGGFYEDFDFASSIAPVLKNFKKFPSYYEEYLGENCIHFTEIMKGLDKAEQWNHYLESRAIQYVILREEYLYNSFISYLHENPNAKVLMQFGRCHTNPNKANSNCAFDSFKSLAYRINHSSNPEVKGKILSVPIVYLNSYSDGFSDDYTVGKHILDSLDITDTNGELYLYNQQEKDSLLNEFFPGFEYFVINTNFSFNDQITEETDEEYIDDYYPANNDVSDFGLEVGVLSFNQSFDEIQNSLKLATRFNNLMNYYNLFLDIQGDGGFIGLSSFTTSTQTIQKDSARYDLSAFGASLKIGAQLMSLDRKGLLSIALGNSYQSINLGEVIDLNWKSNSIFDNAKSKNNRRLIKNPAYILSLDVRAKYKLGKLLLGIAGGYNLDLSSKYWRSGGQLITDGPKNSLSGWYAGGTISIKLGNKQNNYEGYYY